jgi:hypothetical protein
MVDVWRIGAPLIPRILADTECAVLFEFLTQIKQYNITVITAGIAQSV